MYILKFSLPKFLSINIVLSFLHENAHAHHAGTHVWVFKLVSGPAMLHYVCKKNCVCVCVCLVLLFDVIITNFIYMKQFFHGCFISWNSDS